MGSCGIIYGRGDENGGRVLAVVGYRKAGFRLAVLARNVDRVAGKLPLFFDFGT